MQRLWTGLLLAVTAVVLAGVVYVIGHHDAVPHVGQTPGYTAPPLPTLTPASKTSSSAGSTDGAPATATVRTVYLGDEYTLGIGASGTSTSWTTLVSRALGLEPTVIGERGAGYAKTSPGGKTYADLVDQVVAARPTLVVVSGGRNDVVDDVQTLKDATTSLFQQLHTELPDATLIAVAPIWGDSAHPAKLTPVDNAVRNGVHAANGRYLAIPDPLHGHSDWMANSADPNDRGYRAIADAVTSALKSHVPH